LVLVDVVLVPNGSDPGLIRELREQRIRREHAAMRCIVCRHGDTRPGTTMATFHRVGCTVVNEVPAEVCENCGEVYVDETVTQQLLEMASEAREAHATVLVRDSRRQLPDPPERT
jgi:YgiT-type zinc finger domain-containing protein